MLGSLWRVHEEGMFSHMGGCGAGGEEQVSTEPSTFQALF